MLEEAEQAGIARRTGAGFRWVVWIGLIAWPVIYALVWIHAPWPVRILALAWAALAAAAPRLYLVSLAALFPLFGNNPGGPHALYLLDLGLMAFVTRDLALKAAGRRVISAGPLNGLVRLFLLASTLTLFVQHQHIYCEAVVYKTQFFYNIYNHYANAPMYGMRAWLDLALVVSFFAALRDDPVPEAWRRRIWAALLASLAVTSVLGILEYFNAISLGAWRPENRFITRFGYRRLQSLFWHSGWLAQYLAAIAPSALVFALEDSPSGGRRRKLVLLSLVALFGLTQLLTFQRGGWIALAAGFGAVLVGFLVRTSGAGRRRLIRRAALAVLAASVATALLALAIPPLAHRLGEIARLEDRTSIWDAGFQLGRLYPLSGVGLGNYFIAHHYMYPAGTPQSRLDRLTPHNAYLYIYAERGILTVAIFILLLFGALALLWRAATASEAPPPAGGSRGGRTEALALFAGLTATAVYGVFQDISYVRIIDVLFWLFLGLADALVARRWLFSIGPADRRSVKVFWGIATLALVAILINEERRSLTTFRWRAPDGRDYLAGKQEVRLKLPPAASRVAVPVYCSDPNARQAPVTFTFDLENRRLASMVFDDMLATSVTLALPAARDPNSDLVIRASRSWSPYRYGWREIPLLENGVNYLDPVPLP